MDRIEFIGQTHQGPLQSLNDIIYFFDHLMTVYDVVESVDKLSMNRVSDNYYDSLKIKITSPDQAKLDDVVDYVNNTLHNQTTTYEKPFSIIASREGEYVELSVREK